MFNQKCSGVIHHTLLSPMRERMKVRGNVVAELALLALVFSWPLATGHWQLVSAEEYEIGRIVITAEKGSERNVLSVPANITVITTKDSTASNARTIPDLLRSEAGLVVRDIYGNGGKASADIRGFGEAAGMNCTILIDGRRINNIDMSSPDLTQISLAQVEKVEILRGGAGVLYGNGSTGGVINIVTRKLQEEKFSINASYNAFNGTDLRFGLGNAGEKFSYSVDGSYRFSRGYRQHSEMNAGDVGIGLGAEESSLSPGWNLNAGFHVDSYQLPGPIDQQDWDSGYCQRAYIWGGWPYAPIKTTVPLDNGNNAGLYSRLVIHRSIGPVKTETEFSLHNQNARSFMDSWFTYDRRSTSILGAGEKLSWNLFGADFLGGVEFYNTSYDISPDSRTGEPTPHSDDQRLRRSSTGAYLQAIMPLFGNISFECGGRIEGHNQYFLHELYNAETSMLEILDALYAGVNVEIVRGTNAYLRWSKSFRLPTTDEYFYTYFDWVDMKMKGGYISLKPQKSQDVELGIKYAGEKTEASLSLFLINTQDEIYYHMYGIGDPRNRNENYPDLTKRMGGELQIQAQLFEFVSISFGYTIMDARFDTGTGIYAGKYIPLVPMHKGDMKLYLDLPLEIDLGIDCAMVSDRWFGGDYDQAGNKLSGYTVVGLNFSRRFGDLRLFGAVTNIGDVKYAETAYAGTYYPSPPRNFSLGLDVNL